MNEAWKHFIAVAALTAIFSVLVRIGLKVFPVQAHSIGLE